MNSVNPEVEIVALNEVSNLLELEPGHAHLLTWTGALGDVYRSGQDHYVSLDALNSRLDDGVILAAKDLPRALLLSLPWPEPGAQKFHLSMSSDQVLDQAYSNWQIEDPDESLIGNIAVLTASRVPVYAIRVVDVLRDDRGTSLRGPRVIRDGESWAYLSTRLSWTPSPGSVDTTCLHNRLRTSFSV